MWQKKWGRRWITIDSSRVALSIARQRLLTSTYEYYRIQNEALDVDSTNISIGIDPSENFVYKIVPHITLGSISRNDNLDAIFEKHEPIMDELLSRVNFALEDILRKCYVRNWSEN